jgi:hypothetical protein
MAYDLGDVYTASILIVDNAGNPADAGAITLTITRPDGTTVSPAPTHLAVGSYSYDYAFTMPGRHRVDWVATGANANEFSDVVDVWPADPRLIISLDDARNGLNLTNTQRASDEELRLYIATATYLVEDVVGPVLSQTLSEQHRGGAQKIVLDYDPASITTVKEYVGAASYTIVEVATPDLGTSYSYTRYGRILSRRFGGLPGPWLGEVWVTYKAGVTVIPANVITGARELVSYLYSTSQQGRRPAFGQQAASDLDTAYTPSGFAMPRRVFQLLEPSAQPSGMA